MALLGKKVPGPLTDFISSLAHHMTLKTVVLTWGVEWHGMTQNA